VTAPPIPTPIVRLVHVDNLPVLLARGALHAPNHVPDDGHAYRTIHDVNVQTRRSNTAVPCGPRGTLHDYVAFYFGVLSVMLFQLKTGYVAGYRDGQRPLLYLVTHAQRVQHEQLSFVFSDGHGAAAFTGWFDDLAALDQVPFDIVNARYWNDTVATPDRQRQKQAEFLIHERAPWTLIEEIAVFDDAMKAQVETVLTAHGQQHYPPVQVRRDWYYP
jgi:ssDNA thymidine ADP-ribosyltransferase, DarT